MSTSTKRRSRRLPLLAVVAAAFGLFLTLGAGNAFALSCTTDLVTFQTTVTLNAGETVTMSVGPGEAITATGAGGSINCGGTTTTVDQINVFGTDACNETVIIDQVTGGRFEPGRTPDLLPGINEIEWYVNLGDTIGVAGDVSTFFLDNDTLVINDIQTAGAVRIGEGLPG